MNFRMMSQMQLIASQIKSDLLGNRNDSYNALEKYRDSLYRKLKKTDVQTLEYNELSNNSRTYNSILKKDIRLSKERLLCERKSMNTNSTFVALGPLLMMF